MKKGLNGDQLKRPMPPQSFVESVNHLRDSFIPAEGVYDFAQEVLVKDDAVLRNEDHAHLLHANIAFLWAGGGFEKQQRYVIGQTEQLTFRCGPWQKRRQEQQFLQWFGYVPDFVITLDAMYCATCSNLEFMALLEHEMYHVGQEKNEFGAPKFHRDSGLPKLCIRGHDVEEFVGVVRRYGPSFEVDQMVQAAQKKPELSTASIAHACGTCLRRVA
jgi:hypothetical protein